MNGIEINVKDELMKIRAIKADIESKQRQIDYLDAKKTGIKSPVIDDMPKCDGGCNIYENIDTILDKIDKINRKMCKSLSELCKLLDIWTNYVEKLEEDEQLLINLRYFECRSWRTVAKDLKYDERHVYRLHGKALANLSEIVNNSENIKRCQ